MKLFRSMKKRFRKSDIQSLCILAGVIGIASIKSLMACGDFRMPSNHFEGVSSQGYVSVWKQLDALDLGDASVPILLGAQTYRATPSGELGSGWIMPLFDSGIVQRDENTFDMITPDGTMDFFSRDGSDPNILHGSSGWTGEIQGSDITVYSKCGSGWKMVFRQGRLESLSKGSHELKVQKDQHNQPVGITVNGITRLALTRDEKTGLMSSLQINGKKYLFGYDGKPRIENVGGQNLVGGVESSLHQITYPQEMGGKKETYDFAVTEKMLPDLKITDTEGKERAIVWGLDGRMLQDGEWSYKITPPPNPKTTAAIERKNTEGKSEFWNKDEERGEEVSINLGGVKITTTRFTSGNLTNKIKSKISSICLNKKERIFDAYKAYYNENGDLIRENLNNSIHSYDRDEEGKITKEYENKNLIKEITYKNNKIIAEKYASGLKKEFSYNEDQQMTIVTYLSNGIKYYESQN
jgi:YD repeat-containing protein